MNEFDSLYITSDLHLGGDTGRQIFRQGKKFTAWVDWLRMQPQKRIALVLNGDVFDFFAEPNATYFDTIAGAANLTRIMDRFADVFAALTRFLDKPDRFLVFVLGNHDVELALPEVQETLLNRITASDDAHRSRILFSTDGTGFRCIAGGKSVYCFHGELADVWNIVDHDRLRGVIHDLKMGRTPREWNVSGGTHLIIDLINRVKMNYPIVDLLKPEFQAAVPIVLSFDPSSIVAAHRAFVAIRKRVEYSIIKQNAYYSNT